MLINILMIELTFHLLASSPLLDRLNADKHSYDQIDISPFGMFTLFGLPIGPLTAVTGS